MMKAIMLILVSCSLAAGVVSDRRELVDFSQIVVQGSPTVRLVSSGDPFITVTADVEIIDDVVVEKRGERLYIYTDSQSITQFVSCNGCFNCCNTITRRVGPVEVEVPTNRLESVLLRGSGDIRGEVDLDQNHVTVKVMGSGNVRLRGAARNLDVVIQGSGDCDCSALVADEASVSILGSGDVIVTALRRLDGVIKGSGDVCCLGNPPIFNTSVRGSGRFRSR